MADATDLKSVLPKGGVGSTPTRGTTFHRENDEESTSVHHEQNAEDTSNSTQERQAGRQAASPTVADLRMYVETCSELPTHLRAAMLALLDSTPKLRS